jgi:anion transporter
MTPEIIISFIILILMIAGFITEVFSLSVTAMLGCLAFAITGIIDHKTAFSGFSNDIIFMIAGTMVVGEAMFQTGAAQFLGERIIKAVGQNERRMMFVLILSAGLLSAFTSNSSVMAMFLPLIRSVAASSNGRIKARHLVMPVGISTMVGGGCTIVGSTPQLVTQGLLSDGGYRTLTFFELGYVGFPLLILLALFYSTIGYKLVCRATSYMPDVPEYMNEMKPSDSKEASKVNPKMYVCFAILAVMVAGFLAGIWTVGTVATLAALICVVTGCISTKVAFNKMGWNALIIVGATLGVAKGLNESGAARYIANLIVNALGDNAGIVMLLFVVGFMCVIMSNLLSHTATISLLIPIFIPVANQMGIDPTLLSFAITCFVACGYSTPLGVASYGMTLAEGYKFTDYFKIAGAFNLIAFIIMVLISSARFIIGF